MAAVNLHRALADERRTKIVEELREAPDGLDAQELASRLGLHANTVRWHLGILADAGAISSAAGPRIGAGRPRILYRVDPELGREHSDEYRLLATILTGTLARVPGAADRAEEAGRAWGRYLVRRPLPLVEMDEETATREVSALLDEQGFEPEPGEREIRMHRCPFHDLAETHPQIVCAVHRGLVSGALEELGSELEVSELDVFAEGETCIARLRPRTR